MTTKDLGEMAGLFIFIALALAGLFEAWDIIVAFLGRWP